MDNDKKTAALAALRNAFGEDPEVYEIPEHLEHYSIQDLEESAQATLADRIGELRGALNVGMDDAKAMMRRMRGLCPKCTNGKLVRGHWLLYCDHRRCDFHEPAERTA